ncbi:MAG: aminoacyl-tRNA hydrolase, partial [Clostridia bacterium]|nr:aminoacyl-tRNA hydrolase [Clostridia bacterium]
ALLGKLDLNGEEILIAKPQTYMNLSGNAVLEIKKKYNIKNPDILVVVDDIDLPVGTFRYKNGGSGGTHNGMRNIVAQIGADFPRIRVGIGKPDDGTPLVDFVLAKPSAEKQKIFAELADVLVEIIAEKLVQNV